MHRRLKPRREKKKVRFLDEITDGNLATDCGEAYPALDSEGNLNSIDSNGFHIIPSRGQEESLKLSCWLLQLPGGQW